MQDRNSRPTRSKNNYGGKRRSEGNGDRPYRPKRPSSRPAGRSRYEADGERSAYRGEKRHTEGGFERRGERRFDRSERRGGFDRNERRGGFDRNERRGGFDRSERRGGFDRNERRGGFDRNERRGGFDRNERRGGFDRNERRGGFDRRDNRGFEKRDDRRFDKRNDRRFEDRKFDRENREERRDFRSNRMPALKATPTAYKKTEKPAAKPAPKKLHHEKVMMEKAGNMLYPVPAVLVACTDPETGNPNVMTVAWTGTICSDPAMVSISVRPERYSHDMIKMCGNFTINLTTEELAWATDYCGVKSGRDVNKFQEAHLTPEDSEFIDAPTIKESPVSLECEVRDMIELGSHNMFIAEVLAVHVDKAYMDEHGAFHLEDAHPMSYIHGKYYATGKELGFFGYSVAKKK